jgi:signal transduction histidine kinase
MTESLKTLEFLRQEFVSNVSHEIQTPLTSIAGFSEALKDESLTLDERRRYLDILQEETQRLSRLSENLLRLSSLDSQARRPEPETFRLDTQWREVILSLEQVWESKHLVIEPNLESRTVRGDRDLLHQVWTNLFQNAVKFTPPGGRVTVGLIRQGEFLEVTVDDSGLGIDAADLPFIFDRFFKADRSRQRSVRGNGLGLAIVRKIVDLHEGTVEATSEGLGRGSRFLVRLPERGPSPTPAGLRTQPIPERR